MTADIPTTRAISDEAVHAYGAAGVLACGRETGGAISRHDGYSGPTRRSTTVEADVTCPDCLAQSSGRARGADHAREARDRQWLDQVTCTICEDLITPDLDATPDGDRWAHRECVDEHGLAADGVTG